MGICIVLEIGIVTNKMNQWQADVNIKIKQLMLRNNDFRPSIITKAPHLYVFYTGVKKNCIVFWTKHMFSLYWGGK
jgi:hypothetical protein